MHIDVFKVNVYIIIIFIILFIIFEGVFFTFSDTDR